MTKIKRWRRKKKKAVGPINNSTVACKSCGLISTAIKVQGFCNCVLTSFDYKSITLSSGRVVRVADPEKHEEIRKRFLGHVKSLKIPAHKKSITRQDKAKFYDSKEWKIVRYKILKRDKFTCQSCGAKRSDGVKLCVDHIKQLGYAWDLRLDEKNLQVLCDDCNIGKDWK